ncbi:hypothetical protein [Acinetobacter sp. ANC 4173]|uniref:hypothetical protein n=1 Tax=Acinetobacter sp. ANC 4173 TaxID=2529837 RepID=UPI00103E4AD1|nr:hypothetical protein [Acinetobacter sp. ANC 4173]TCB79521.1 hypothetical protein E0H94_09960 [Acinetobacter sp. ANC 4173]
MIEKKDVVQRGDLLPSQWFRFLYNAKKWVLNKGNTSVLLFAHFELEQPKQNDVVDLSLSIPCIEELAQQLPLMQNLTGCCCKTGVVFSFLADILIEEE